MAETRVSIKQHSHVDEVSQWCFIRHLKCHGNGTMCTWDKNISRREQYAP